MAVDNFTNCLSETLKFEGGWSNNPRDPGGATMSGVTLQVFGQFLGRPASQAELRNISRVQLLEIYRKLYWNPIGGDSLPKGVDMILFDIAVNSGDGREHLWALRTAGLEPIPRIKALDALRRGFWRSLKIFRIFGKGWFNRENSILQVSLKMASQ